jgi:sensor domain CHASE-containing protein
MHLEGWFHGSNRRKIGKGWAGQVPRSTDALDERKFGGVVMGVFD